MTAQRHRLARYETNRGMKAGGWSTGDDEGEGTGGRVRRFCDDAKTEYVAQPLSSLCCHSPSGCALPSLALVTTLLRRALTLFVPPPRRAPPLLPRLTPAACCATARVAAAATETHAICCCMLSVVCVCASRSALRTGPLPLYRRAREICVLCVCQERSRGGYLAKMLSSFVTKACDVGSHWAGCRGSVRPWRFEGQSDRIANMLP